jgi:4-alpha-glucanotransferase
LEHDLIEQARRWGVEPGYHDVFGNWHEVPPDTLRTLIAALSAGQSAPASFAPPDREMRAFQDDGRRLWGLTLQLYAVRSQRNWGIGDFRDLRDIVAMTARTGAAAIGVNPLHALFVDRPQLASPYAPNSRLFLNPLYIAVDELEWFDAGDVPVAEREALRRCELVDYPWVTKLKLAALRAAYDRMRGGSPPRDFDHFRGERGDSLRRFACFEVLRARYAPSRWWEWPAPWSHPTDRDIAELYRSEPEQCGFIEFLQWVADRQLAQCSRQAAQSGLPIGLYLDLAVGVEPSGADAWSNQRAVMSALSIGAPPDEFNPGGQNWALVPFNPHALSADDFAAFRELLAATMRHAGAVRLDHVLGLMRLYLIPRDTDGANGAYVRYPFEQLLRLVAEESQKHRCIIIGEDLGTVPEGFRDTAARWGVWSYRVMMFERGHDGAFRSPQDYPADALATFSTHDLPTFAGWIAGSDLATKRAIGVAAERDEDRARDALRHCLSAYAGHGSTDNIAAAARFLAATPSHLVTVTIDDLLGTTEQVNIPGTVEQHPNWRRKVPLPLEQWEDQPAFVEVAAAFRTAGRAS